MRYFAEIAYRGTPYYGWQRQPNQITVQEVVEKAISTILNQPIEVTGCGRTDTGVHASQYFLHFDFEGSFPAEFIRRLNKFLPKDIVVKRLASVAADNHTRYDAFLRSYEYHLIFQKDPFRQDTAYFYPFPQRPDRDLLQNAARLLLDYEYFDTFCKTNTQVKTTQCQLKVSEWEFLSENHYIFHISANRFLRGMVRLIVGMCLDVSTGQLPLEEVQRALENRQRLPKSKSAPAAGLFLTEIRYPYEI